MHETGQKILNLMFRPGETVCVSHNKYGYHSIPLESAFKEQVTLVSPNADRPHEHVSGDDLLLVALNPIKGFRSDENCKAYRNFLVEMDEFELKAQIEYINRIGLPYSAIIFSGNKSMHFLVSLDQDLPNEKVYRILSEWMLKVAALADDKTKNPSRSIRIPGGKRKEGLQRLVYYNGPVKLTDLIEFLQKHPEAKPKLHEKKAPTDEVDLLRIKKWARDRLRKGLNPSQGRNAQWYAIAYEFALAGYSESDTVGYLEKYFSPERDFKEREWLTTIKSAFKHAYEGK